jgi:hypothetical protein
MIRARTGQTPGRYDIHADCPDGRRHVHFEISADVVPPVSARHDVTALALLFLAMRNGWPLHVAGQVSRALLVNLAEFQAAWSLWVPGYRQVEITADEEVPASGRAGTGGAVCAFSGGVDASFALLRHAKGKHPGKLDVEAAVLVHGFDIPLREAQGFETARLNAVGMTRALGVALTTVRTNWRDIVGNWEHEFGAGMAAALALFEPIASVGVFGSDEDYGNFVVPWGSNPITNHLLSSDTFRIHTEGGGYTRTAKVAELARHPAVAERLRVCWRATDGQNCGVCEKCTRTALNFVASANAVPRGLGSTPGPAAVARLRARNKVQVSYLQDIEAYAGRHGIRIPWLRYCIAKNKVLNFLALRRRARPSMAAAPEAGRDTSQRPPPPDGEGRLSM